MPNHSAGAEFYVHTMAKALLEQGHEVKVLLRQGGDKGINDHYEFDGIKVYVSHKQNPEGETGICEELITWSTHIVSHLENIVYAVDVARLFRKKVFFISHNSWDYPVINQRAFAKDMLYPVGVIYNSEWMRKKLNYPQRSIVLRPPLDKNKVSNGTQPFYSKKITIINSNERKGGAIFAEIVKALPEYEFLIVAGGYDNQICPQRGNVQFAPPRPDMLQYYSQTRILLVPSAYESWSMSCSEAMANGIPVICSATPGLKENAGGAGIFINSERMDEWMKVHEPPADMQDPDEVAKWLKGDQTKAMDILNSDDIAMWVKEIRRLDEPEYYFSVSNKCENRAVELDPRKELLAVEKFMEC